MAKKSKNDTNNPNSVTLNNNNNYFEIMTMLFIFSILLIDFFPQLGSLEIIAPQYLYLSIINSITSLFIYKNPALLSNSIFTVFKKSWVIKAYVIFLIICAVSTVTAHNFSLAIVSFIQLTIVFCMFVNLAILLHNRLHLIYNITLLIAVSVFIQSFIELNNFINLAKSSSLVAAFGEIKGNTGNINIFAASLTGKIPFLLLGIVHFSKWKKWFLSLTLFIATLLILLIASRASYIALFLIVIGFIVTLAIMKSNKKLNINLLTTVLLPLIIAFLITNLLFKKSESTERFSSISDRVATISPEKNDASVNIRLKYWENAIEIAKSNPVLGIGLGNWKLESIPFEKKISNRLTVSDHPHNDFLEIAAETGFLNLIVYLSLFFFALAVNIKRCSTKNEQQTRIIAFLALLLMISYGIDALFNFPLYRTTMQINFCLFLVLTVINTNIEDSITARLVNKNLILTITTLSVVALYFSYSTFKAYQLENDIVIDLAQGEANYTYSYDEILTKIPKFPNVATNSQPYIELAGIYAVKEKKYDQAIKYFNQSEKINPYTGRAEWYKYRIYKEKEMSDSARYYAQKAFEIRPRNEDYYLSALVVDANAKDTTAILKTHNQYIKYIQSPSVWINTSSALAQSQYSNNRIIDFIDSGLVIFPKDSTLLNRKKSFQKDAALAKAKNTQQINVTAPSNIIIAAQYAAKENFNKALEYYKKASKEDPNNIIITQNIGICYFKTNQFKSAIVYLEKTLNSPLLIDGKTEFILGASYLNTNNKEKGCKNMIAAENKNYPGAAKIVAQYCN
ncbi:O-antigen ligase/Tfp pilus assembly protein PilF [Flavobacterium sp. 7E]|uniref:O-antigen ligase family protein n=1 Tax=Flavobacterium sp. 7E TaxID=2735898 RepID=UPI00156DE1C6|nr:O-antigen ligase family protein [Flavobacterium sp. 7E]NRS87619.1 O-antigen ligase/Tfp pilus assembly protein PilF [Flavobacterium sp. 7E]